MLRSATLGRSLLLGQQRKLRPIEKCQYVSVPQFRDNDSDNNKFNLGSAGPLLNAQGGSTATVDANTPLYLEDRGLRLPGVAGNSASAPDSAALDITGDIDLAVRVALDDYTPIGLEGLIEKYGTTGNQRAYRFFIDTGGFLLLVTSTNGTDSAQHKSSVALSSASAVNGETLWLRVTLDVDNGAGDTAGTFYYSRTDTNVLADVQWSALGSVVALGGTTIIFASTAELAVGARLAAEAENASGLFSRSVVKSGIDGTVVFDADFTQVAGGATSFTESSVNAATVTINQTGENPARIVSAPMDVEDGTNDYFESPDAAVMNPGAADSFMAIRAGLTYDTTPAADEVLFGKKDGLTTALGWQLVNNAADTAVTFRVADGTTASADVTGALTAAANYVVAGVRDIAADTVEAYLNGTSLGTPVADASAGTLLNTVVTRTGADGAVAASFEAGEHHGTAFRNCFGGPAPNAREVEVASRQLAAMTGRYF